MSRARFACQQWASDEAGVRQANGSVNRFRHPSPNPADIGPQPVNNLARPPPAREAFPLRIWLFAQPMKRNRPRRARESRRSAVSKPPLSHSAHWIRCASDSIALRWGASGEWGVLRVPRGEAFDSTRPAASVAAGSDRANSRLRVKTIPSSIESRTPISERTRSADCIRSSKSNSAVPGWQPAWPRSSRRGTLNGMSFLQGAEPVLERGRMLTPARDLSAIRREGNHSFWSRWPWNSCFRSTSRCAPSTMHPANNRSNRRCRYWRKAQLDGIHRDVIIVS